MTQAQRLIDAVRRRNAYRAVLLADNENARLVLRDLMREAIPRTSLISPGKPDITAANCGVHAYASGILRMLFSNDEDLKKQISELREQEQQQQL